MRRLAAVVTVAATTVAAAGISVAASKPTVATGTASGVTRTTATVTGSVNPNANATMYAFQYGTTRRYGLETQLGAASGTAALTVTGSLAHLTRGRTYHYRLIATSALGTSVGRDATFRTAGRAPKRVASPRVRTAAATRVTVTRATLHGIVEPRGHAVKVYFEFGPTKQYGFQTAPRSVTARHASVSASATLTRLDSSRTYHYRVVALDADGDTVVGADSSFRPGRGRDRPLLRGVSIRPRPLHAGQRATVTYSVSQRVTTMWSIVGCLSGPLVGCSRPLDSGTFARHDRAGRHTISLGALRRGSYELELSVANGRGFGSRVVRFTVT